MGPIERRVIEDSDNLQVAGFGWAPWKEMYRLQFIPVKLHSYMTGIEFRIVEPGEKCT